MSSDTKTKKSEKLASQVLIPSNRVMSSDGDLRITNRVSGFLVLIPSNRVMSSDNMMTNYEIKMAEVLIPSNRVMSSDLVESWEF